MSLILNDIAKFVNSKIEISEIDKTNYVSTENMIQNKGGVSKASSLPKTKSVRAYLPHDILLNNIRPYFKKIWFSDKSGGCSSDIFVIRVNEDYDPKFIYYVLSSDHFFSYVMANAKGTKMPRGDGDAIKNYEIPNFSFDEQRKISNILGSLDKKIEINKKLNKNLLKLSNCIYQLINMECDDYKVYKLSELCEIKYGKNLPTKNLKSEGFPVYGGNGIIGYYDKYIYDAPQILVSCRGASSGKVLFSKPYSFVTNNSLVLECKKKYYYFLKEFSLKNEYYEFASGSAQPQITINNLKNVIVNIPNDTFLKKYNQIFENLETNYFNNLNEIDALINLRDTLLPQLMSGEIDVSKINCDLKCWIYLNM